MKKLLIASTAITAVAASAALADISFSGSATIGMKQNQADDTDFVNDSWFPYTSAALAVSMSGETDGGLSFGAASGINFGGYSSDAGAANGADIDGFTAYIGNDTAMFSYSDDDGGAIFDLSGAYNGFTYGVAHDTNFIAGTSAETTLSVGYALDAYSLSASYNLDSEEYEISAGYTLNDMIG